MLARELARAYQLTEFHWLDGIEGRAAGSVLLKAKIAFQGSDPSPSAALKMLSLCNVDITATRWVELMAAVAIRNISDETHRALRARAAPNGLSIEAEARDILEAAVRPSGRVKLGSLLAAIGRDAELSSRDVEALQQQRERTPAEPMTLDDYARH